MKNSQDGFVVPILLVIIALLVVGGGVYFYENKKAEVPAVVDNTQTPPPVPTPSPTLTPSPTPRPTPKPKPIPKPSPTPIPVPADMRFEASPMLGAPPLNVFFGEFSSDPLQFDNFSIDYGDGSHDSLQQQCFERSGAKRICQVIKDHNDYASHNYTSSGTFTVILHGIGKSGSQILGTLTILVGNPLNVTKKVGEKESSFLIQKINRDSVEGLWHEAYPVVTGEGTPKTLRIGDNIGYGCEGVSDKLTNIDFSAQKVVFTVSWSEPPYGGCPVCLAGSTLIDTPSGLILVKDLQVGMSVWTTDKTGHRVLGVIAKTSKVPVPSTHQMVHLILNDGRELFVSPGHPTIDGRTIGDLVSSEVYNGATIVSTTRVPYGEGATYDLLPSGDTGFYWANDILIGSTLR